MASPRLLKAGTSASGCRRHCRQAPSAERCSSPRLRSCLSPRRSAATRARVGDGLTFRTWEAVLAGEGGGGAGQTAWQQQVSGTLPDGKMLEERYEHALECDRAADDPACTCCTCSFCYGGRGHGLTHRKGTCFNHWGGTSDDVSAVTGVIRGGAVQTDAENRDKWTISTEARANDVEYTSL